VLAHPDAIVFRPSLLFGPGDSFFQPLRGARPHAAGAAIAGAQTKFQPVAASDVAEAIARAVEGAVEGGRIYECGGPAIRTLRELVEYTARTMGGGA
jgi:NADH dehydrogenase